MASSIDPTKPAQGVKAKKSDLRANFQAAKDEIEANQADIATLQTGKADTSHTHDVDTFTDGSTNLFLTAAERSKLAAIEASATADLTAGEIQTLYEGQADTNRFTDALLSKLNAIEAGATADLTGAEIQTLYEGLSGVNRFTDEQVTKLNSVGAGADVSDGLSLGLGEAVYKQKDGGRLEFKSITERNSSVRVTNDADTVYIQAFLTADALDSSILEPLFISSTGDLLITDTGSQVNLRIASEAIEEFLASFLVAPFGLNVNHDDGANEIQISLGDGTLSDPGADRIFFWDESANAFRFLEVGSGLSIAGTVLSASASAPALDDITDVTISSVANGEVLGYSSGWINRTLAEAGIAAASHTHAASDVNSGTFADARIAETNVTQHEAALAIAGTQLTGLALDVATVNVTASGALTDAANADRWNNGTVERRVNYVLHGVPSTAIAMTFADTVSQDLKILVSEDQTGTVSVQPTGSATWEDGTTTARNLLSGGSVTIEKLTSTKYRLIGGIDEALTISTAVTFSGAVTFSSTTSGIDHGALDGLADDDHTQYLLVAGTRAMTGALDMNGQNIDLGNATTNGRLIFDLDLDTYLQANADDSLQLRVGGGLYWTATSGKVVMAQALSMDGQQLRLDDDEDSYFVEQADDVIDLYIGGAQHSTFSSDTWRLISTSASALVGPILNVFRDSASPAVDDILGALRFTGRDAGGVSEPIYGQIRAVATAVGDGAHAGRMDFTVGSAGSTVTPVTIAPSLLLVGKTAGDSGATGGLELTDDGLVRATRSGAVCANLNRINSDGQIVSFRQGGTQEGNISVSGNTVSYNAFLGSHRGAWQDDIGEEPPVGTVLISTGELIDDRHPKVQVSTTRGDPRVYGVYRPCGDDDENFVAALGVYYVRVKGVVEPGDLLRASDLAGVAEAQPGRSTVSAQTLGKALSGFTPGVTPRRLPPRVRRAMLDAPVDPPEEEGIVSIALMAG